MLLSPSRVVCGVTGRHNNWLKMRWRRNGLDCCGLSFYRVETENGSGSGANYLKAIIRNKSTEVGKEESSRVEIRDGSLFSSSLSQSSSIPSPPKAISSSVPKNAPYRISDEIYEAIKNNSKPVVALESAIITHGMPYPDNIQTAMHLQTIIRQQGVIPATVGVIKGQLTVGLSDEDIETLGSSAKNGSTIGPSRTPVVKVSRRDLPYVLSHKLYGGTTVSGTIIAAVKAHIPIFVTGGLGGVHRGAESTFDISADLKELGRSPIAVISAGVKSILDIGKTLEYLETEGVCVCVLKKEEDVSALDGNQSEGGSGSVGRRTKFPSFFTQESPFTAPYWVQNEMEAAQLLHSSFQFGLQSGILIAVPIPKEFAASGERIDKAIGEALERARRDGINGKDMTPFLLGIVSELTGGKSLEANKHLVENNARVGAQIALQLARLRKDPNDTLSVENLSSGSGGSTGPGSLQSNHRHNDAPTEKGNASDRKLTSSKSTLNLKNLSHQSPIRNPTDKRSISTSTQTSTRLPSSAPLTFSHTSNPTFPPSTSVSVLSTSNPAVASSGHPHGPTSFKYNDNGNVMIDFDRNKRESGIGALVVEQQSHGRFVAATLEQESTSKSESKRGNAFEKTVAHDRRDRNGGDDKSIKSKGTGSCVEVDEIQVPGNKEPPNHPFSSTTRPVVIGGTSLDLVLRVQEENIVVS